MMLKEEKVTPFCSGDPSTHSKHQAWDKGKQTGSNTKKTGAG